ncbi:ATP-dependent zinc protease, partial [Desulfobulbus sp. N2]|nr:ATP-dependent zinc protease [Desulfobulbus sp. N2]
VELTLASRDNMGFRMLLGREAFRDRFMVDGGRSYYGGRPDRKKKVNRGPKTDSEPQNQGKS